MSEKIVLSYTIDSVLDSVLVINCLEYDSAEDFLVEFDSKCRDNIAQQESQQAYLDKTSSKREQLLFNVNLPPKLKLKIS
jgi:hypothetical protein